ncbi:hypothetical protein [Aliterella atlantica]|uniref:hypothetical protein n=1 Tax=Aliterella atlantica TaxID=1827278 RepID=UPI0030D8BEA5
MIKKVYTGVRTMELDLLNYIAGIVSHQWQKYLFPAIAFNKFYLPSQLGESQ